MRHTPMLLALAVTMGAAAPALAHDTAKPAAKPSAAPSTKSECCDTKDGKADACDPKAGKGAACDHKDGKGGDCCKPGGSDACADDKAGDMSHGHGGHDGHHDQVRRRVEVREYHTGNGAMPEGHPGVGRDGRMPMMAAGKETHFGLSYLWNVPTGTGYTMVTMEHLFGRPSNSHFWNPKMGMGASFGMDLADQNVTRTIGTVGWIAQNGFKFGPVKLTAGVLVGGGLNVGITQNVTFQNYNGFFLADPRLTLGWQVTPHMSVEATGNYLFTTRPAAVGGPGAGLRVSHSF